MAKAISAPICQPNSSAVDAFFLKGTTHSSFPYIHSISFPFDHWCWHSKAQPPHFRHSHAGSLTTTPSQQQSANPYSACPSYDPFQWHQDDRQPPEESASPITAYNMNGTLLSIRDVPSISSPTPLHDLSQYMVPPHSWPSTPSSPKAKEFVLTADFPPQKLLWTTIVENKAEHSCGRWGKLFTFVNTPEQSLLISFHNWFLFNSSSTATLHSKQAFKDATIAIGSHDWMQRLRAVINIAHALPFSKDRPSKPWYTRQA